MTSSGEPYVGTENLEPSATSSSVGDRRHSHSSRVASYPEKPQLQSARPYYHFVSFVLLLGLLVTNLFLSSSSRSGTPQDHHHPTVAYQWCANPHLAGLLEPVSCDAVVKMPPAVSRSVFEEATRIAAEFEYPTGELVQGVWRYRQQMEEGLAAEGATLSQIPSYITAVPNGTEKV